MPVPAPSSASAAGPRLIQQFTAELDHLGTEDTELAADLSAQVVAAIETATSGAEPQPTLSVDQAAAVAFSVLTRAISLGGPGHEVDGQRALALRRAEELAALQAEIADLVHADVASMSVRRLAATVLRRRPLRRNGRKRREQAG